MTQPTNDLRELVEELRQGAIHLFYGNRMRSAADTIEALIAERDAAVAAHAAARENFHTMQKAAAKLTNRATTAEAREARMRKALTIARDHLVRITGGDPSVVSQIDQDCIDTALALKEDSHG